MYDTVATSRPREKAMTEASRSMLRQPGAGSQPSPMQIRVSGGAPVRTNRTDSFPRRFTTPRSRLAVPAGGWAVGVAVRDGGTAVRDGGTAVRDGGRGGST